jgi:hypothetical protein
MSSSNEAVQSLAGRLGGSESTMTNVHTAATSLDAPQSDIFASEPAIVRNGTPYQAPAEHFCYWM